MLLQLLAASGPPACNSLGGPDATATDRRTLVLDRGLRLDGDLTASALIQHWNHCRNIVYIMLADAALSVNDVIRQRKAEVGAAYRR